MCHASAPQPAIRPRSRQVSPTDPHTPFQKATPPQTSRPKDPGGGLPISGHVGATTDGLPRHLPTSSRQPGQHRLKDGLGAGPAEPPLCSAMAHHRQIVPGDPHAPLATKAMLTQEQGHQVGAPRLGHLGVTDVGEGHGRGCQTTEKPAAPIQTPKHSASAAHPGPEELAHATVKGGLQPESLTATPTALELGVNRDFKPITQASDRNKSRTKTSALATPGHHPTSACEAWGNQTRRGPPTAITNWPGAVAPIAAQDSQTLPRALVAMSHRAPTKGTRRAHIAPI